MVGWRLVEAVEDSGERGCNEDRDPHDPLSFEASPINPLAIAHHLTEQASRFQPPHTRLTNTQFQRERRLQ